jgi:pantoate kinase
MKSCLIPLYMFAAVAFVWSFTVLLGAKTQEAWAVPVGTGFTLIGATAALTAYALRTMMKRIDDLESCDVHNSEKQSKK